jgi:hypothetical protein
MSYLGQQFGSSAFRPDAMNVRNLWAGAELWQRMQAKNHSPARAFSDRLRSVQLKAGLQK